MYITAMMQSSFDQIIFQSSSR